MATAAAAHPGRRDVKEVTYSWEGRDRSGKIVKGDMRASGEAVVQSTLRRQGIAVIKIKRQRRNGSERTSPVHSPARH
jgi:type IV pilus assembly protein PilC